MNYKKRNRWIRFGAFLLALVQMLGVSFWETSIVTDSRLYAQNVKVGGRDYGSLYETTGSGWNVQPITFTEAGATVGVKADYTWGGTITMLAEGTFEINDTDSTTPTTLTVEGAISGAGDLIKIGDGTFLLDSTSTLTGKTIIQEGIFAVGSNGVLSDNSAVEMLSGTVLDLSAATNQMIASLSGRGEITLGNNNLTLGSDNTDTTFVGTISGAGDIIKEGTGTFTFEGDSSGFTGTMQVNAGTLSGLGIFGNVVVETGATFAPGDRTFDAPDVVSVENLDLNNGSTLSMRIDGEGFNDQIMTNGAPSIGPNANLEIDALAGNYDSLITYDSFIIDSTTKNDLTNFNAGNVSIKQKFLDPIWINNNTLTITRNPSFFTDFGISHNQLEVGKMLDQVSTSGPWKIMTQLSDLNNNPADVRAAFNEIASDLRANSLMLGQWRTAKYGLKHLDLTRYGESMENAFWFEIIHQTTNFDRDGNSSDYGISRTGFVLGSEERREETTFGMLVAYSRPYVYDHGNKVEVGDFHVGFYGGARIRDMLEMKIYIGYGHQSYDLRRFIHNPLLIDPDSTSSRITGEAQGDSLPMSLEFALPLQAGLFSFRPVLAIDSDLTWQYGFRESGDTGLELAYRRGFYDRTFLRVGCTTQIGSVDSESKFVLLGRLFYGYQVFGEAYPISKAHFLTEPSSNSMKIHGVDPGKSEFNVGVGLRWNLDLSRSFYGDYDLLASDKSTGHYGSIGYMQKW